jgi:hypothetical protein
VLNTDASAALTIQPPCGQWLALLEHQPSGTFLGKSQQQWREITRRELGLRTIGKVIATGHQTLLWHPGILAKYLVVDALAGAHDLATANLVVDQHAEGFGDFEIPLRKADGSLVTRRIELCRPRPRKDVPMGWHEAFTPPRPPEFGDDVLPSVAEGVKRVFDAVYAHRQATNAAMQMADAVAELMKPWVKPMVDVTSTQLLNTTLGRAMLRAMADDPWRCAECYNRAVTAMPEVGIAPLLVRDDYVELPLWRIREDGRRMHAYDGDVVEGHGSSIPLMPRALFMTALVRLGMCDLFIHGFGGANYDRAMEVWIRQWLGVDVASIAMATADLRLPLMAADAETRDVVRAQARVRRLWHDPTSAEDDGHPSSSKKRMFQAIAHLPRDSAERRAAFLAMHKELAIGRSRQQHPLMAAQQQLEQAKRHAANLAIAQRRDWAFSLYPHAMIDELAAQARRAAACAH